MRTSFAQTASEALFAWVQNFAKNQLPEGNTSRRKNSELFHRKLKEGGATDEELRLSFPELYEVEVPAEFQHIQQAFIRLNLGRQEGFNGPNPLSYSELLAYCTLLEEKFTPGEIELLKIMDVQYMNVIITHVNSQKG